MTAVETTQRSTRKSRRRPGKPSAVDARERRLFKSLDLDNDGLIHLSDVEAVLKEAGLAGPEGKFGESLVELNEPAAEPEPQDISLSPETFFQATRRHILLLERVLQGRLVVPDFAEFSNRIGDLFDEVKENRDGETADYIPQLDLAEPEADRFGLALCTIDGQQAAYGDSETFFTVQSTCKPVQYCLALEEHGAEVVHRHVGHEPSGASFNELALSKTNLPHNPLINAGAIMCSSLVGLTMRGAAAESPDPRGWKGRRFDYVVDRWTALAGGERPRFSTPVYLSERETADRNYALAYFMRESGAFPEGADLEDVLEFYFQCCSVELNAEMMSVVAATLANGGICPLTGERVLATETVQRCLSLMSTCGMYDYSGEFAFHVGLPAKSGVSGAIMVVIPNVMGFCTYSPRLDELGNSVRGIEFCRRLVAAFNFHQFDNLTGASAKADPRISRAEQQARRVNEMIWAASKGDLGAIQELLLTGSSLVSADYDLRTPLHLAAAEGRAEVVRFIIAHAGQDATVSLSPRDRWGGTPINDARANGHADIATMLKEAGAKAGRNRAGLAPAETGGAEAGEAGKAAELIWAASTGDLTEIRRLIAQGVPLNTADYDRRTPLHLAAAEGQADVVAYLLRHGADADCRDRWSTTPLDEARRNGHDGIATLIESGRGRDTATQKAAA